MQYLIYLGELGLVLGDFFFGTIQHYSHCKIGLGFAHREITTHLMYIQ